MQQLWGTDKSSRTLQQVLNLMPDLSAAASNSGKEFWYAGLHRKWEKIMTDYRTRFIKQSDAAALVNLYHLAHTALAGDRPTSYDRRLWAAKWFAKEHPEVTASGAYKDLDGLLA